MAEQDLVAFSARRIQAQEQLPALSEALAEGIHRLAQEIVDKSAMEDAMVAQFLNMLEGVPAEHSLRAVAILLDSVHEARVRAAVAGTRAVAKRTDYFDRVCVLAELFAPARVDRITETARYIEAGWGW